MLNKAYIGQESLVQLQQFQECTECHRNTNDVLGTLNFQNASTQAIQEIS